jgi:hypothetical protein
MDEKLIPKIDFNEYSKDKYLLDLGNYEIKEEDGKIFAVLKKPKYPATYDKCCNMLNANEFVGYELMANFPKLINARNAYWQIAGEELELGKPWKPNWTTFEGMPAIFRFRYNIVCGSVKNQHCLLVFPTEEMRDAFYENFKDLIEKCKELL